MTRSPIPQDAGDEGACAGVGQEPATDIYANQGWTPDDPAISGEQSTGGVRDKVFQAIISGDDAWDITDRVLAALSAPVDNPPTGQACGGEIEGWTCQSCARLFRENPSGALVMDPVDKGEAVAMPRDLALFLLGEGSFDGHDFGDVVRGPGGRILKYWWRKNLRAALQGGSNA